MSTAIHYARTISFDRLVSELEAAQAERLVHSRRDGDLQLWCYSSKAVYDQAWSPIVRAARGLILDRAQRQILATPFPKFFNLGELGEPVPKEPCEIFEKVDGSLIILFHDGRTWRTATKGAFDSSQALWAAGWIAGYDLSALTRGTTYLVEAVYPENRIIVRYQETGLIVLAAYDAAGIELTTEVIGTVAGQLGWRVARREYFADISEIVRRAETLSKDHEGFVLKFSSGHRLKVKGNAYRLLHALVARVTPLGVWDMMAGGEDLDLARRLIPEEFWWDFDEIRNLLDRRLDDRLIAVAELAANVEGLSDRELGMLLKALPKGEANYLFSYRRNPALLEEPRTRRSLLRDIRPTDNVLSGYEGSNALRRVAFDE